MSRGDARGFRVFVKDAAIHPAALLPNGQPCDVLVLFISAAKQRNPAAAKALQARVDEQLDGWLANVPVCRLQAGLLRTGTGLSSCF